MMQKIIIKNKSRAGREKPKGILVIKSDELGQEETINLAKKLQAATDKNGLCILSVPESAIVTYIRL